MHLFFCSTVLLFYCSPCLAQKDYFPTKPSVFQIISVGKILKAKLQSSQSLFLTTENTKGHENISFILCISCSGKIEPQIFGILGISITSASDKIP